VAEAFQAETIRFQPEERAFRLVTDARGSAIVRGNGLNAVLAAAVLEREGFEIVSSGADAMTITVGSEDTRWELATRHSHHVGNNFAALAELVRTLAATNL
jgi:hypothetical protein